MKSKYAVHRHTLNFYFVWEAWGAESQIYIQLMLDFKTNIMEIMPRSPSRHLVRLQEKLQLPGRGEKYLHIRKFVLYCPVFQYTSLQPISVADLS